LVDQEQETHHNCVATTSAQSLFFTAKIPEQDIVAILEELSHAAEIAESRT